MLNNNVGSNKKIRGFKARLRLLSKLEIIILTYKSENQ